MSVALVALGRVDEARSRLEVAVRKRPAGSPHTLLAQIDINQKHFDRASNGSPPEKAGGRRSRRAACAVMLFAAGRPDEAVTATPARRRCVRVRLAVRAYRAAVVAGGSAPEASLKACCRLTRKTRWCDTRRVLPAPAPPRSPLPSTSGRRRSRIRPRYSTSPGSITRRGSPRFDRPAHMRPRLKILILQILTVDSRNQVISRKGCRSWRGAARVDR